MAEDVFLKYADAEFRPKEEAKETDYKRTPWGPFKALDLLNRLGYPVQNTLRRATDPYRDYSAREYWQGIKNGFLGRERSQTSDTFENIGWKPTTLKGKILRGAVGLAGDILLDPMTYVPLGQLTKVGKLAEAGKLVKYGDKVFNITNKAHANELLDIATKGLQAAGKNADEVGKVGKLFTGIFRKGAADDIVKVLNEIGGKGEKVSAEVVKLAPTWAKQYKLGQRALAQFEVPRIIPLIGGKSAEPGSILNIIRGGGYKKEYNSPFRRIVKDHLGRVKLGADGRPLTEAVTQMVNAPKWKLGDLIGQKVMNLATAANRRVRAGRMLTDKNVLKALPEATLEMRLAANKGNLVKLGEEVFNLGNKTHADRLRAQLLGMASNESPGVIKKISGLFKGKEEKALADKAVEVVNGLLKNSGLEKVGLGELNSKRVAAHFGQGTLAQSIGMAGNQLASALNIVPKTAKAIRRLAVGASSLAARDEFDNVIASLGLEGQKKLTSGIKEGATRVVKLAGKPITVGGDDLLRLRLEALEGLGNRKVAQEVARLAEEAKLAGRSLTVNDLAKALDVADIAKARGKANVVNGIEGIGGLDSETVSRMKDTLFDWSKSDNGLQNITDLSDALKKAEEAGVRLGSIEQSVVDNRYLTEGLGYLPRRKVVSAEEEALRIGSKYTPEEARLASRNQTIFEAARGYRTPTAVEYLKRNRDKIITHDRSGKGITGGEILSLEQSEGLKKAQGKIDKMKKLIAEGQGKLALKREELAKAEKGTKNFKQLKNEVRNLMATANKRDATLGELEKAYNDLATKFANTDFTSANKNLFDINLQDQILKNLDSAQRKLQRRIALTSMVDYGVKIEKGKSLPEGYVRASDVLSSGAIGDMLKGAEGLGEYKGMVAELGNPALLEKLKNTAIPYQFVRPLKEMIEFSSPGNRGAILATYDTVQSMLKQAMLWSPSTHFRNFVSSFAMAYAAGDFSNPVKGTYNLLRSALIGGSKGKFGGKIPIRGRAYSAKELWDLWLRYSGGEAGRVAAEILPKKQNLISDKAISGVKKAQKFSTRFSFLQNFFAENTENTFRFSHFINELQKGASLEDAVESVALHFYDYGDLSKFEKNVSRRFIPFYTFWRKNMEANFRYAFQNAGYLSAPWRIASNVNRITEDDPRAIPMEVLNNSKSKWLLEGGAYRLPWDPTRLSNMSGFLPQAEFGMPSVSPLLRTPIELMNNYDYHSDRPITSPDRPAVKMPFFDAVPPSVVYALRPIRAIDVFDRALRVASPKYAEAGGYQPREKGSVLREVVGLKDYQQDPLLNIKYRLTEVNGWISKLKTSLERKPNMAPGLRQKYVESMDELMAERDRLAALEKAFSARQKKD